MEIDGIFKSKCSKNKDLLGFPGRDGRSFWACFLVGEDRIYCRSYFLLLEK